jgi:putative glutamine amidotransferase
MTPLIGVTGPDRGGLAAWLATAWAIRRAGGRPVRIRPGRPRTAADLHGLVLGGGADVSPTLYGASGPTPDPAPTRRPWQERLAIALLLPLLYVLRRLASTRREAGGDTARDTLERDLLDEAMRRNLPILGICRGMQLLNVHLGGTLHRALHEFYSEHPQWRSVLPSKQIKLEGDSRLARIFGRRRLRVNALHHQAIDRLGRQLRVVARERSGVVQAIEVTDRHYCFGVQWHPEYLPQCPEQHRLFRTLVDQARAAASR